MFMFFYRKMQWWGKLHKDIPKNYCSLKRAFSLTGIKINIVKKNIFILIYLDKAFYLLY